MEVEREERKFKSMHEKRMESLGQPAIMRWLKQLALLSMFLCAELCSYADYKCVLKKKNSPLDKIKMNGTDAKTYSSNLTVIGYFSNLPRIIFKKSSESNTTEKYLRKFQVLH